MDVLEGFWRLVDSRAWNVEIDRLAPVPYGADPLGQLVFSRGRMLLSLWHGDVDADAQREPSLHSFAGRYTFDGCRLECEVVVASDPGLVGARHGRDVVMLGDDEMLWRPPARVYGMQLERRELVWQRVWRSGEPAGG